MSLLSRFRKAVGASLQTLGTQRFRAGGEVVACPVCGDREFVRASGGAYMKPMLLGLNAPWLKLDRHATSLICTHCAHILTFGRAPEVLEDDER